MLPSRRFLWCACLALSACRALLGIEAVTPADTSDAGNPPAHAGGGAQAGAAGGSNAADAGNQPADASQTGDASQPMSDAGDSGADGGKPMPDAGADAASDGSMPVADASNDSGTDAAQNDAGPDAGTDTGTPPATNVHGKVIDFQHNAVSGVSVRIGEASATTDAQGEFDIAMVAASYDVSLSLSVTRSSVAKKSAWLFEGLTRRDPTLQVYTGLPERSVTCLVHVTNVDFDNLPDQSVRLAFGSPHGSFEYTTLQSEGSLYANWEGPSMTQGTVHALRLERNSTTDLVTKFLAYATQPLALTVGMQSQVTFSLGTGSPPANASVAGTATGPGINSRTNFLDLHFTDGALLNLAIEDDPAASFTYLVPNVANATASVLAVEGQLYPVEHETLPFLLARVDSPVAGQSGLTITIPNAATPSTPSDSTTLAAETQFSWNRSAPVSLLVAKAGDFSFYVVTEKTQAKLPTAPLSSWSLPAATSGTWQIETHGNFQHVDDAAGASGFLDEDAFFLRGPHRGPGTFGLSERRTFTTSP